MTGPVDKAVRKVNKNVFLKLMLECVSWGGGLGVEGRYTNKEGECAKYILHHIVKSVSRK